MHLSSKSTLHDISNVLTYAPAHPRVFVTILHSKYSSLFTHSVLPVPHSFLASEESDYHTDYEEDALESALSDMETYSRYGEHTEGEETADTVRTCGSKIRNCGLSLKRRRASNHSEEFVFYSCLKQAFQVPL